MKPDKPEKVQKLHTRLEIAIIVGDISAKDDIRKDLQIGYYPSCFQLLWYDILNYCQKRGTGSTTRTIKY